MNAASVKRGQSIAHATKRISALCSWHQHLALVVAGAALHTGRRNGG